MQQRIHATSRYGQGDPDEQLLVDRFVGHTVRYQQLMLEAVQRLGLARLATSPAASQHTTPGHRLRPSALTMTRRERLLTCTSEMPS